MSVLSLRDVEFTYPSRQTPTLSISSLDIEAGQRVFVHGPSGSGKTTMLELLAGVLTPQKGSMKILDTDVTKLSDSQRDHFRSTHLGYIFQSFNLIPYLTVNENIELPIRFSRERAARLKQPLAAEIRSLIDTLGLGEYGNRPVTELSVGQQQRVAVARALIGSPEIILADEPTSALDHDHREKFLKLLFDQAAQRGMTVLFVSHDRSLKDLFDRDIHLSDFNGVTK